MTKAVIMAAIVAGVYVSPVAPQRSAAPAAPVACPRCAWTPPKTDRMVRVRTASELQRAVRTVKPRTTIGLDDGEYRLDETVEISVPGTVIRGLSGNPSKVVIRGSAITEGKVGVGLAVGASDVTIADLTVGFVGYHGIQVRGERGAARVMVHDVHIIDTGQQLFKVSVGDKQFADAGTVACSRLEYSTTAPSDYTNGVDLLATKGWVVRDNVFVRIRGPRERNFQSGPAVLAWANSLDTVIERNIVLESYRGIALGLGPGASRDARDGERRFDTQRGVVRNNVVCNNEPWVDEALEANGANEFTIDHNTVFAHSTSAPWSIGVRFATGQGVVRNNLTTQRVLYRNGGRADVSNTVTTAQPEWFVDAARCDLHLLASARAAIDAGAVLTHVPLDFDRAPRLGTPDLGAFEFRPRGPAPSEMRAWR